MAHFFKKAFSKTWVEWNSLRSILNCKRKATRTKKVGEIEKRICIEVVVADFDLIVGRGIVGYIKMHRWKMPVGA